MLHYTICKYRSCFTFMALEEGRYLYKCVNPFSVINKKFTGNFPIKNLADDCFYPAIFIYTFPSSIVWTFNYVAISFHICVLKHFFLDLLVDRRSKSLDAFEFCSVRSNLQCSDKLTARTAWKCVISPHWSFLNIYITFA